MAKPHILFAAYQVARGSNGGMESATRIFEALSSDFNWTLMTNRETPRTARWRVGGAKIVSFPLNESSSKIARAPQLGLAAFKALFQKADVLHGNDIRCAQILLPAAKLAGTGFALTVRDTKAESDAYGSHWQRIANNLDVLVSLSNEMDRRLAMRLPISSSRRKIIGSIVDPKTFCRPSDSDKALLRAKLGIAEDECAVGMVAGVFEKKRQKEVIRDVLPTLSDLDLRLHIIGDFDPETDKYAQECLEIAIAKGLRNRVVFHGFRSDVADWLAALDIVLVASRREGLARCMIEAMSCGTPVVSVDVCSAKETLESTGAGIVVGSDDFSGLAQAIRSLCADADRRELMGRLGRQVVISRFSEENVAADWRALYSCLSDKKVNKTKWLMNSK
jgi:glycosyltransferase involved in cell wall biosynthesis